MSKKRMFTVSTQTFKSLKAAEKQLLEWSEGGELRGGTRIFEVTGVYKPIIKKVVSFKREL